MLEKSPVLSGTGYVDIGDSVNAVILNFAKVIMRGF